MKKHFTLAPIFNDNMMFQAHKPIRIYGKCKKNINITVKLLNQEKTIRTKSDHFLIELDAEDYCDKGFSLTIETRKQSRTIYNCMVGDVFLFLGGRNIVQTLTKSSKTEDYNSLDIRFLNLQNDHHWLVSGRDNLDEVSVLAYLFAKNFQDQNKVPLGVVIYGQEDENIFTWSDKKTILTDFEIKNYINGVFQKKNLNLSRDFDYIKERVFDYKFKSIVIYQGENDFSHFHFYEKALRYLIKSYRMAMKDLYIPFHIVQISSFESQHKNYIASSEIRIAQSQLCSDKQKVYVSSVVDIDEKDMVSLNKNILSKRLVNLILEKQYKMAKNTLCPQLFSYRQRKGHVDIYVHQNFLSLISRSGQKLGFYYTDNSVDYYPINHVEISSNQISIKIEEDTKEIRYAYDDNPTCDIFTSNGLPLLPFKITLTEAGQ
jgi:sialate O-acetylesterase